MRSVFTVGALAAVLAGCSGGSATGATPVPVATVTLSASSGSLTAGATLQLTAVAKDAGGNSLSSRVITWSSTTPAVATVSSTGLVSAVAAGTTTVSATSEGKSAGATITVTPPVAPVASIVLSPSAVVLLPGSTMQLTDTTKDGAGNILVGRVATWTSSASPIATVSSTGMVTAVAIGTATITVASEGKTATATVTVTAGTVIGSAGGTVTSTDGNATVVIPAGALLQPTGISVVPATTFPASALLIAGTPYDFEPSGTQFAQPVTVRIRYDPAKTPAGMPQRAIQLDIAGTAAWSAVGGSTVDTVAHLLQGPTTHFTNYSGVIPPLYLTEWAPFAAPLSVESDLFSDLGSVTVCAGSGMAFSTYWPRGGQLGTNAINITSDQPTIARASAYPGQPPKILLYGNLPGTATVSVVVGTDTVRLRVTVINTTPPCEHVVMAVKEAVPGGDLIYKVLDLTQTPITSDLTGDVPALGPLGTGSPPFAFISRTPTGQYFEKTFFDGPNTVEVDVPVTPNTSPLTSAFYDANTLLIVQQSTIDGAGDIYAITRASGLPIRLTNLHGVINSIGAGSNGQLYIDWRPLGSVGTHVFRLPYPGVAGPPVTTGLVQMTSGTDEYQPALSQNNTGLAYVMFDPFFSHSQVFVQDLTNPATPAVAISPASGLAFSPQFCANWVYFTYSASAAGPYNVMRVPAVGGPMLPVSATVGANVTELSIATATGPPRSVSCPQ